MNLLLWPAAMLYDGVTRARNFLFDHGWLRQEQFDVPVISVGNLAVGGTGKTPHVEMIVGWLLDAGYRVAVLSRGYGRDSRGYRCIDEDSTARDVGDEPLQMYRRFAGRNYVSAVCERRAVGIRRLISDGKPPEVILLDDAYQHRYVKPGLSLLLTDAARTYDRDALLPMGRLREARKGAARADIIVVTKCAPAFTDAQRREKIRKLCPTSRQRIFFTSVSYADLPPIDSAALITGIANPAPLLHRLAESHINVEHLAFPDHHKFTTQDRNTLIELAARHENVLTTEKDAVRLELLHLPLEVRQKILVIRIGPHVLFDETDVLRKIIIDYVSKNPRSC